MKIRNAHGVKLSKLVPGCVAVTQFGPVVVKKVRVPKKILRDADYYATANVGPAARVANIRVTIQLFNTVPVIGRLLDPDATIWRTDIAFGSVERILKPHQIEDLEPPFLTVEGKSCCGCGEGCGEGCGGNCGCHGAESAKTARDVLEAYAESSASGLPAFKAPIGFNLRWFIRDPGSDNCELVIRLRRNQCRFPELIGKVVDGKVVLTLSDAPLAQKDGSAASILKDMIQEHVKKPGIVPYRFEGKPWVKV